MHSLTVLEARYPKSVSLGQTQGWAGPSSCQKVQERIHSQHSLACGYVTPMFKCWRVCKTAQPLWKTVGWFLIQLNLLLPYEQSCSLVLYPKELKTCPHENLWCQSRKLQRGPGLEQVFLENPFPLSWPQLKYTKEKSVASQSGMLSSVWIVTSHSLVWPHSGFCDVDCAWDPHIPSSGAHLAPTLNRTVWMSPWPQPLSGFG